MHGESSMHVYTAAYAYMYSLHMLTSLSLSDVVAVTLSATQQFSKERQSARSLATCTRSTQGGARCRFHDFYLIRGSRSSGLGGHIKLAQRNSHFLVRLQQGTRKTILRSTSTSAIQCPPPICSSDFEVRRADAVGFVLSQQRTNKQELETE